MEKEYLVSVIVPVYNVEKYLKRCMETLVMQSLQDIEIILVNDGSTDGSPAICDEYKAKYPDKIKVIHQENKGLGPARNAGLEIAAGKYIGFVDSDDWITIDMFEKLYNCATEKDYDLVFCDMFYVDAAKSTITKTSLYYKNEQCDVSSENAFLNGVYCYAWNKLYKSEIIKEKRFPNLVFEDIPVITSVMAEAKKIGYLPESLYFYERKPGTLSTTYKSAKMLDTIEVEKMALENVKPDSRDTLLFVFAKRFFQNIFSERKVMKADLIEHISDYKDEYKDNKYIKKYKQERIYSYLGMPTIPKTIVCANFENRALEEFEEYCTDSWKNMTRGFEFVELNADNCDVASAPECVQKAFEQKNYKFVEDYFKVKYVYENGGIAVSYDVLFNAPIGEIRAEKTFFGFKNKTELMDNIFGSISGAAALKDILDTYEADGVYAEDNVPFIERMTKILVSKYGLNLRGWTQTLNETIKVYKCDILCYDMQFSNNVTKLMSADSYKLIDSEYDIIEKSVLQYWSEDKDNFWKEKEKTKKAAGAPAPSKDSGVSQQQLNAVYAELAQLKNSKSWKITAPLRKFYTLTHRKK